MIHPLDVFAALPYGEIRYSVITEYSGNLDRVLSKFGLLAESVLLVEHERTSAHQILSQLLHKDVFHGIPNMSEKEAADMAERIIACHECPSSRYYSNASISLQTWNPLTDATFDGGLIITGSDKQYFCIWIEEED